MLLRRAVVLFVLLAGCSRQVRQPVQDSATGSDHVNTLFVKEGKGIARLPIKNDGESPLALTLSSGPVTDATTGAEIQGAAISFKTEANGQALANASAQPPQQAAQLGGTASATTVPPKPAQQVTVPAHSSVNALVNVSGLTGTTWARMEVFNQGTEVGKLDLVVLDDPVNATIEGVGSTAATPLSSTYGSTLAFTLKNNSAEFLALDCSVELRDSISKCGTIVLPPNTSKSVPVDLDLAAYSWTDWVQPSAQAAGLKLTLKVPPGTSADVVPIKALPLNLTVQGVGPLWLSVLSLIYVGVFLFIGGYLSVLASTVLPNLVKKAEMRKQVNELANRTSSVSTRVDSYLRVLLRLERKKIQVALDFLKGTSPSAAEQFNDISIQIAGLLKRLTVAERLDKLRRAFEDKSATAPPSISDGIDKNLDTAAIQLHSFALNDADVAASNAYLDKAESLIKLLDDKDAQSRLIAQNYVQLRNRLAAFPKAYYTDLREALAGLFDSMNFGVDPASPPAETAKPTNGGDPGNAPNTVNPGNAQDSKIIQKVDPAANPVPDGPTDQPPSGNSAGNADAGATSPQDPVSGQDASEDKGGDVAPIEVVAQPVAAAGTGTLPGSAPANPRPSGGSPSDFSDPKNIIAPMFFAIDHGIAAIQTALDYAIVRASVAVGTSRNCANPGEFTMKRLMDHECQLLNLLGTLSWKSLRGAIALVQQMREDVYEDDVYSHIKDSKAKIVFDTQRARPFLPVFFSIGFDDPRLNGAAALDWVALDWTFPNELHEAGWKICHYFDGKESADGGVPVAQTDPDRKKRNVQIKVEANSPRWQDSQTLETKIEVQPDTLPPEKAGVFADRLRFGIAFGVALAGLKSGALDQLAKLGFVQATVAIIALGFGADTVKNVLTQSSKPQSTATPPTPPSAPKTGT